MEKRITKPDRRNDLRREQDELRNKALNDLLEAARRVVGTVGADADAVRQLNDALTDFASRR